MNRRSFFQNLVGSVVIYATDFNLFKKLKPSDRIEGVEFVCNPFPRRFKCSPVHLPQNHQEGYINDGSC